VPRLIYTDRARDDLVRITTYIARVSGRDDVASRFYSKLRLRCQRLARLPAAIGTLRPELGDGIRSTPTGNYLILFRYRGGALEIVTIVEGHRDLADLGLTNTRNTK
jgi:toxin ParE1/3/4